MYKGNHKELEQVIMQHFSKKIPLYVWGSFGIGKSDSIEQVARLIAKEKGMEFSMELKDMNREDVFMLWDKRMTLDDPTDIKGLPNLNGSGTTKWLPPEELPKSGQGILFLDELNLAPPMVQKAAYQLINKGRVGSYKLPQDWYVIAAGNRNKDKANVFNLPAPLLDRFTHFELQAPSVEKWTSWASKNGVDKRVMSFLNFRKGYLNKIDFGKEDKSFATPRAWDRVSQLIKGVENTVDVLMYCSCGLPEGIATEFNAFLRLRDGINLQEFLKNPEKASIPEEMDKRYALITALAEHYSEKSDQILFDKIAQTSFNVEPEYGVLLLRLCKEYCPRAFSNHVKKSKFKTEISKKYIKFITNEE